MSSLGFLSFDQKVSSEPKKSRRRAKTKDATTRPEVVRNENIEKLILERSEQSFHSILNVEARLLNLEEQVRNIRADMENRARNPTFQRSADDLVGHPTPSGGSAEVVHLAPPRIENSPIFPMHLSQNGAGNTESVDNAFEHASTSSQATPSRLPEVLSSSDANVDVPESDVSPQKELKSISVKNTVQSVGLMVFGQLTNQLSKKRKTLDDAAEKHRLAMHYAPE